GAEADIALGAFCALWEFRVAGQDQAHGVVGYVRGQGDLAGELLELEDPGGVGDGARRLDARACRSIDDSRQFGARGEADLELEEKSVQLSFRQGVGALQLDRVLRGQDEERPGQRMANRT